MTVSCRESATPEVPSSRSSRGRGRNTASSSQCSDASETSSTRKSYTSRASVYVILSCILSCVVSCRQMTQHYTQTQVEFWCSGPFAPENLRKFFSGGKNFKLILQKFCCTAGKSQKKGKKGWDLRCRHPYTNSHISYQRKCCVGFDGTAGTPSTDSEMIGDALVQRRYSVRGPEQNSVRFRDIHNVGFGGFQGYFFAYV